MKKIGIFIVLVLFTEFSFGQVKKIKIGKLQFKIKENYILNKNDTTKIEFTDTLIVDSLVIAQNINISEAGIDPEKNGVNDISDFSKFEKLNIMWEKPPEIETNLEGVTEIGSKRVYYYYDLTEGFSNHRKKELIEYVLSVKYYFFEKSTIYKAQYVISLMNNKKMKFDRFLISKIMRKTSNIGDLNIVVENLKIKN